MTTRDKGITLPEYTYVDISSGVGLRTTDLPKDYTSFNAWIYGPNFSRPINATPGLGSPTPFAIIGQNADGSFAAFGGDIRTTPGTGTGGNGSGNLVVTDTAGNGGRWNTSHVVLGAYHLWIDLGNRLRVKPAPPVSDTDGAVVGFDFSASAVYDPPNLADGTGATTTVAVAGAVLGDFALASFSLDLQGITVTAYVSAPNVVSVRFQNESGGPLDILSGTLRVKVVKQ